MKWAFLRAWKRREAKRRMRLAKQQEFERNVERRWLEIQAKMGWVDRSVGERKR